MEDLESTSIERHDLYNFETKINYKYTLETDNRKKASYLLDIFFFIPKSLQINKDTYNKEKFFSDINNLIRFTTPKMSIGDILNDKNELSPLNIIEKNINQNLCKNLKPDLIKRIQREFRLLASILKTSLKDNFLYIKNNYEALMKRNSVNDILNEHIENITRFKIRFSLLKKEFVSIQRNIKIKETFQYSDEYISLQIEEWSTQILNRLDKRLNNDIINSIIKIIEDEQSYRKSFNSRLILRENTDNEQYTYMEGIMKKYVQGVLYLNKKKKKPQTSSLEILYSIGAGLAMFISLFIGFFLFSNLEANSIPFIFVAVVIYMLRDRIKDNIRGISQKAVGLYFPDQKIDILDGFFEEKIGISEEKMYFIDFDKIPKTILQIRKSSNKSSIEEEGKPEVCILFKKRITLFNEKISKLHTRHKDILDVTRFNIQNFLRYADDPIQKVLTWKKDRHQLNSSSVSKVYHINLVFKLSTFQGKKIKSISYQKYRVILNQKGIKKVRNVKIN